MFDWLKELIALIIAWLAGEVKAIEVKPPVCMPLFYRTATGKIESTWPYLSKSPAERDECRAAIKAAAKDGEQPAISFLLTPANLAGGIWSTFPIVNGPNLDAASQLCKELVEDGIAVFPTLYVDDPTATMPKWWEIGSYLAAWQTVYDAIGQYCSGFILSIESNERTTSLLQLQGCISEMKAAMGGGKAQFYGTHLQWKTRGGKYNWTGNNAPSNAKIVLMETSNDPHADVPASAVKMEWQQAKETNQHLVIIVHEFNLNVGSANHTAARNALREAGAWGIG